MHQQTNVNKRTNPVISYRPLSISFEHTKKPLASIYSMYA